MELAKRRQCFEARGGFRKLRFVAIERHPDAGTPADIERRWESRGYFRRARHQQNRQLLHPAAAAQRHRHAAHGPRLQPGDHGCADALPPHARRQHAVAAGHRPRRHRHADRGRAPARRQGISRTTSAARSSSKKSGSGRNSRQHHHAPDAPPGHLARLEPRALHDGRRAVEDVTEPSSASTAKA
jgi:hypothetical protein